MAQNVKTLLAAGVPIVLGTDAGNPLTLHGPSVFVEMEAMAAAGMTPTQVLVASTRDAARALGRDKELGAVAVGKVANVLVLPADPTADVRAFRALTHVVRGGVLHERAALLPK
jgi:imidazolonepropionase-like amidohydrolase